MTARYSKSLLTVFALLSLAWLSSGSSAADLAVSKNKSNEGVDLFQALEDKLIEVKFIASNDKEAHLMIKNVGNQPLSVKVPGAFAGVPVLAQAGRQQGGARGGGQQGGGQQNQGLGGGGGGGGGGGQQGGGAAFNIAPEKVAKLKIECVCLDHGKADPNARIEYEIKPIDSYATDPAVGEAIKLMVEGKVSQRVTQIAAWHLNNHMSFEQLAAEKIKHLNAPSEIMFTTAEIKQAVQLVQLAKKNADANSTQREAAAKTASASAQ